MSDEQIQQPDFAGYADADALAKGYRESGNEAKRQRDRAEAAERQLQQLLTVNPRQDVTQRNGGTPYDRLRDLGVPPEDLREAVRMEAGQMIQEAFTPIAQGFQARNQMLNQYSDYNKFEADVAKFISDDPDLSVRYPKMFNADPAAAMDYAFLKFGDSRRRSHKAAPGGAEREAAAEARIPSSRGAGGGGRPSTDGYDEAVNTAFQRWQQTGSRADGERFAKLRLNRAIPDSHLQG
jgi:hypothetical protein